jgi:hypothetical protein
MRKILLVVIAAIIGVVLVTAYLQKNEDKTEEIHEEKAEEMKKILTSIAIFLTILLGLAAVYDLFTTKEQKERHKQKLSRFSQKIHSMRSLELAQNDACFVLSWMNRIYGKPSGYQFFTRDFWGRRPVCISILLAALYIEITAVYISYVEFDWDISHFLAILLVFVPINAFPDLISVNISRILFFKMTKSFNLRTVIFLILLDIVIAFLLYLTGPAWMSILSYVLVEYPFPTFLEFLKFWDFFPLGGIYLFGAMFLTTLVPTVFHLLISFAFFGSKAVAQPLRLCVEKILEHMIRLQRGVTALFAIVGTIIIHIVVYIVVNFL